MENCSKFNVTTEPVAEALRKVILALLATGIVATLATIVLFLLTYKKIGERTFEKSSKMVISLLLVNDLLWMVSRMIMTLMESPFDYNLPAYYTYIYNMNGYLHNIVSMEHGFLAICLSFVRFAALHFPNSSSKFTRRRALLLFLFIVLALFLLARIPWVIHHFIVHYCRMNDSTILTYVEYVKPTTAANAIWSTVYLGVFYFVPGVAMTYFMVEFAVQLSRYHKLYGDILAPAEQREKDASVFIYSHFAFVVRYCILNFCVFMFDWIAEDVITNETPAWMIVFTIASILRVLYFGTTWIFVFFLLPKFSAVVKSLTGRVESAFETQLYRDSFRTSEVNDIVLN